MSNLPDQHEKTSKDIILDYCKRFPDAPSKTLAALVFRQWPDYFRNQEHCRSMIRYYFGQVGCKSKKYAKKNGLLRESRPAGYLPKSESELDWTPVILEPGKTLVLSDLHIPFHHEDAVRAAIMDGKKMGVNNVVLNGDVMDTHQLSRFSRRPDIARYDHEVDSTLMLFDVLRQEFPKSNIYWKLGNHEERLEDFLAVKAIAFWGLPAMDWTNLLKLRDFGIKLVKDKRPIKAGNLFIFHGHEFPKGVFDPVNPARGFFLRGLDHILGSHFHRSSQHSERTVADHVISTWSIGCCCQLHPRYAVINRWTLGHALIEHNKKEFVVNNRRFIDGKAY